MYHAAFCRCRTRDKSAMVCVGEINLFRFISPSRPGKPKVSLGDNQRIHCLTGDVPAKFCARKQNKTFAKGLVTSCSWKIETELLVFIHLFLRNHWTWPGNKHIECLFLCVEGSSPAISNEQHAWENLSSPELCTSDTGTVKLCPKRSEPRTHAQGAHAQDLVHCFEK